MSPRLLVAGVAALTLFAVTACTSDDPPADTAAAPSTNRTATIDGSGDPTSSGGASPGTTTSGGATQGNSPGGGAGGNPTGGSTQTGGQPTPRSSTTHTAPPPSPPPPGSDNSEACNMLLFAELRMLSWDLRVSLLDTPELDPQAEAQIRQELLDSVYVTKDFALTALGLTTDPVLRATINQFVSALNGVASVVPTGTPAEIANAMASPTMMSALTNIESMCP